MDEHLDVNRKMWDDLTPIHERSSYYDQEGFKAGNSSLKLIEVEELGPVADAFDEDKATHTLALTYPYFGSPEPTRFEGTRTYTDPESPYPWVSYEWTHSLGQIISALTSAGLRLEFLHEFPFCEYAKFPCMHQDGNGWWRLPEGMPAIPFLFSLKALKD